MRMINAKMYPALVKKAFVYLLTIQRNLHLLCTNVAMIFTATGLKTLEEVVRKNLRLALVKKAIACLKILSKHAAKDYTATGM